MIKDLSTLKWKKYIYYIFNNIIFDIEQKKKKFDIDNCETYIIDIDNAPEKIKNAVDGTTQDISKYSEIFIDRIPYIEVDFITTSDRHLKRYFPLQYLIEEGDAFIDNKVIQLHPDVYDNLYVNKFNQEVFNFIKSFLKNKEIFRYKNISEVLNALPDWLTSAEEMWMTEDYIDRYFLRGFRYNRTLAIKTDRDIYKFNGITIGGQSINIWNEENVSKVVDAINAEKIVNNYKKEYSLSKKSMEDIANTIKNANTNSSNPYNISSFLTINRDGQVTVESICTSDDIDTYYEYEKIQKEKVKSYYSIINDETSWNENYKEGTGLWKYYQWSDLANAPYKEDLWNTVEKRAANINDAKKNDEGEYELDENGNYIYENCERCWKGAINAPGAKYPWVVVNIADNTESTVSLKYHYPDGIIKEVKPWGDKILEWGCASIPKEFNDNSLINDGFIADNFEFVLT